MKKYIAYYRVSTKVQGLGLEAQKYMVSNHIRENVLLAEYSEKESGKKNNRTELLKALEQCKRDKAILIIAKLDRLSRNVSFVSSLMDSKVKFVCCDMPDANEFTIHIFAAIAEWERKTISERTTASLQSLKRKGIVLGKPENFTTKGRLKGIKAIKEKALTNDNNIRATEHILLLKEKGKTLQEICDKLNSKGFRTSKGFLFNPIQVSRLLNK